MVITPDLLVVACFIYVLGCTVVTSEEFPRKKKIICKQVKGNFMIELERSPRVGDELMPSQ